MDTLDLDTHAMEEPKSCMDPDSANNPSSPVNNCKPLALTGPDCAVCTDHAPPGITYRRHYGVICCEACKCFFRRTVQMNRDYKCRSGGRCYVGRTTEHQKQVCQACRFQQCVRAGMKLESVKRFPRKRNTAGADQDEAKAALPKNRSTKKALKGKQIHGHSDRPTIKRESSPEHTNGVPPDISPNSDKGAVRAGGEKVSSPRGQRNTGEDLLLCDTDLANVKFKMSPSEAMLYMQSASASVPQLFKYDSLDSLNEKPVLSSAQNYNVATEGLISASQSNLTNDVRASHSMPEASTDLGPANRHTQFHATKSNAEGCGHFKGVTGVQLKRGSTAEMEECATLGKKLRLEMAHLMQYQTSQFPPSAVSVSSPPITPLTPLTPSHLHSQPPSRTLTPEPLCTNSTMSAYVTPHATPSHTPHHSPLSSPTHMSHPASYHGHLPSQGATGLGGAPPKDVFAGDNWPTAQIFTTSSPSMSHLNLSGVPSQLQFQPPHTSQGTGAIIFNSHPSFQVLASTSLLPMVLSPLNAQLLGGANKSPFRIIPIPSINKIQPEELPGEPYVNVCDSPGRGDLDLSLPGSAPASARTSPVQHKQKKFTHFAEARLEEVLDSLRLRIRYHFSWAKSEVSGFDDLSPMDQKALLRRTVPELVMLGFARGSIAYNDLLLLGRTGKVIRPNNLNSGVASVASVTLQKLVVPLKVLNIDDRELTLLKEIVLFNPESNGLRNREVVRVYRKNKHLKLMEYTEKSDDPGRFGELLCLLTPLFEVSTEVTEQLRLEQFVHEGEARIDALLLMSMISGVDEIPDEHSLDSQQLL